MHHDALTVVYVVGSGRSGSTLLDLLLGSLAGVTSMGEFSRLWSKLASEDKFCGCGEHVDLCPFWREVLAASGLDSGPEASDARFRREQPFARGRALPGLRFQRLQAARERRELRACMADRAQVYRAAAKVAGSTVLVDSSKSTHYLLELRRMRGIRVRPRLPDPRQPRVRAFVDAPPGGGGAGRAGGGDAAARPRPIGAELGAAARAGRAGAGRAAAPHASLRGRGTRPVTGGGSGAGIRG